jgi:hypothetical protein
MYQSALALPTASPPYSPASTVDEAGDLDDLAAAASTHGGEVLNDDDRQSESSEDEEEAIYEATAIATAKAAYEVLYNPQLYVDREHPPPPEAIYPSFEAAKQAATV